MAKPTTKSPQVHLPRNKLSEDFVDLVVTRDDDDEFSIESSMMDVVCVYQGPPVRFKIDNRRYKMTYGDVAQLEANYCIPRQMRAGGDPLPSAIELLTGFKVLAVQDRRVQKNADGVPLIVEQRRQEMAERAARVPKGRPEGASAQ